MSFISEEFREALEKRIAHIETHSSLEIVPMLVRRSSDYRDYRLTAAYFVFSVLLIASRFVTHPLPIFLDIVGSLALAGFVYWIIGFETRLVPAIIRERKVAERAMQSFISEEVFATRKRSGILILVSLAERAVFVLADKGLCTIVDDEAWGQLGERLAADFDRKNPGASFFEALDEIYERLKASFPPEKNNDDELPNRLRGDF